MFQNRVAQAEPLQDLAGALAHEKFGPEICASSARHLSGQIFSYLSSQKEVERGRALGVLYEALVYECCCEIARRSEGSIRVVRKWADVPNQHREAPRLGQNGLFYNSKGDITLRGDGLDLAELDFLVFSRRGHVRFGEVVISRNNMDGLEDEIRYKKRVLDLLFGRDDSKGLLVAPIDLSSIKAAQSLVSSHTSDLVILPGLAEAALTVAKIGSKKTVPSPENDEGLVLLRNALSQAHFDYRQIHEMERRRFLSRASSNDVSLTTEKWGDPLLKHLILGRLDHQAVGHVLSNWTFSFPNVDPTFKREQFDQIFSEMTLALRLSGLRPTLYLKPRGLHVLEKMGPTRESVFGFEREIGSYASNTLF